MLVGIAVVASLVLVGVYLAAGGASYAPAKTADPCKHRPWGNPEGLEQIAQQFTLSALDGAACQLGVSREELAQALASSEAREKFADRYEHLRRGNREGGPGRPAASRQRRRKSRRAQPAGRRPDPGHHPQRPPRRSVRTPQNARSLLNSAEGFLGPAQGFLEEFLP